METIQDRRYFYDLLDVFITFQQTVWQSRSR